MDSSSTAADSKIFAERPFFQARKVEAMNVLDQRDKSARAMIERGLALVERSGGSVPGSTAWVKVLRHPAEAGGVPATQQLELVFHGERRGLGVRRVCAD